MSFIQVIAKLFLFHLYFIAFIIICLIIYLLNVSKTGNVMNYYCGTFFCSEQGNAINFREN